MLRKLNKNCLKSWHENRKSRKKALKILNISIKKFTTFLFIISYIIFCLPPTQNLNVFESISLLNISRWDNFHFQNAKTVSHDDNDDCKKGKRNVSRHCERSWCLQENLQRIFYTCLDCTKKKIFFFLFWVM